MKLPDDRPGLPGKVILFHIVPLSCLPVGRDPAYMPIGRQGGACGARSGQKGIGFLFFMERISAPVKGVDLTPKPLILLSSLPKFNILLFEGSISSPILNYQTY